MPGDFFWRVMLWVAAALPIAYYIALSVVTGLEKMWIPFALAVSGAAIMLVWLIFNVLSLVAALKLVRAREQHYYEEMQRVEMEKRRVSREYSLHQAQRHMSESGHQGVDREVLLDDMDDDDLSSIATTVNSADGRNPLAEAGGRVRASSPGGHPLRPPSSSSLEDTYVMSPPGSHPASIDHRAGVPAITSAKHRARTTDDTDKVIANDSPDTAAARQRLSFQQGPAVPTFTDDVSAPSKFDPKCCCDCILIPPLSIPLTVLAVLHCCAASFIIPYYTHCLFASLPVFMNPFIWATLASVLVYYDIYPALFCGTPMTAVVRVLLHWSVYTVMCLVSLGIFVAAFCMELTKKVTPYYDGEKKTALSVIAVTYLSPIPLFAIICVSTASVTLLRSSQPEPLEPMEEKILADRDDVAFSPNARRTTASNRQASFMEDDEDTLSSIGNTSSLGSSNNFARLSSAQSSRMYSRVMSSTPSRVGTATGNGTVNRRISSSANASAVVSSVPHLKTVTMLYIAYRETTSPEPSPVARYGPRGDRSNANNSRALQQTLATNFESLMEALEDTVDPKRPDENAFILTAYEDALCLIWGLLPFSSDPVQLAVEKANKVFKAFRNRPAPPVVSLDRGRQELVAAVVYAPHSLVGLIGNSRYRSFHFFNPTQHAAGDALLRRGVRMYAELPSALRGDAGESSFTGILLDSRAAHSSANSLLARPCGVVADANGKTASNYAVMYDFLTFTHSKEEEWHLLVQRREMLGKQFSFLSEATQCLQQNHVKRAREVLEGAVSGAAADDDNVAIARLLLEDLRDNKTKEL